MAARKSRTRRPNSKTLDRDDRGGEKRSRGPRQALKDSPAYFPWHTSEARHRIAPTVPLTAEPEEIFHAHAQLELARDPRRRDIHPAGRFCVVLSRSTSIT